VACTIRRACGDATVDVILHLAALSSPYYCQFHPEEAWRINVPIGLLELNADIIYMSTDQVYDGTGMFYSEDDKTLPVNLYGRTKLAFERVLFMSNRISGGDGTNTDSCENGDDDGLPPPPLLTPQELGDSILPDYLSPQQLIQHYPTTTTKSKSSHVILRSSLILGAPPPFTHGCKKGSSFLQFVQQRLTSCTSTDYYVNEYRSMVHVEDVITALIHFTRRAVKCHIDDDDDDDDDDNSVNNGQGVRIYNLGGRERVNRYELAVAMAKHLKILDYAHCVHGVERPKEEGNNGVPSPTDISINVDKLTKELGVEKLDGLDEIIRNTF